jgi:hypothetical protein
MFYNAMSIFVRKHYGGTKAGFFNFLVHPGIWIRAFMAGFSRFIQRVGLPLIDAGLILLSFWIIKIWWSNYIRPDVHYDQRLLWIATLPLQSFISSRRTMQVYTTGGIIVRSLLVLPLWPHCFIGGLFFAARAVPIFKSHYFIWGGAFFYIDRSVATDTYQYKSVNQQREKMNEHASTLIIASAAEYDQALQLMKEANMEEKVLGRVAVTENDASAIGHWAKLNLLFNAVPFREAIFCEGTLSFKNIIDSIERSAGKVKFKIHATDSHSIVGSDSKDSSGETLSENGIKLADPIICV